MNDRPDRPERPDEPERPDDRERPEEPERPDRGGEQGGDSDWLPGGDRSERDDVAGGEELEERSGLGLTEEFARIEAEIEQEGEIAGPAGERPDPEPRERAEDTGEWLLDDLAGKGSDDPGGEFGAEPAEARTGASPSGEEQPRAGWETVEADVLGFAGADDDPEAAGDAEDDDDEDGEPASGEGEPADGDDQPEDGERSEGGEPGEAEVAAGDAEEGGGGAAEAEVEGSADATPAPTPPLTPAARVREHPVVRPMPKGVPAAAAAGGAGGAMATAGFGDDGLEDRTPSLWLRFLTGSVLIVAAMATATVVTGLLYFSQIAEGLGDGDLGKGVDNRLEAIDPGEPQTILIMGSDKRTGEKTSRSDTTMLLRVDADQGVLSLLSLPRDLRVNIPGVGINKLNEAYARGGPKLTLETVKNLTGLKINHVVNIDFEGFAKAVDAIGCVYVDVDQDYYHSNEGLYGDEQFAEIDVNPGYQRLCGQNALDYVRYRHTDNDLVRAARQQTFLREARQKVPPSQLLLNIGQRSDLIDIFTEYTDSDIDKVAQVLGILKSFINVIDVPVNQIELDANIGGPEDPYVTASQPKIEKAVAEFLGEGDDEAGAESGGSGGNKGGKEGKKKKKEIDGADVVPIDQLFDPFTIEKFARTSTRRLHFPVYYPTEVMPGTERSPESRQYDIKDPDDRKQEAYKLLLSMPHDQIITEWYGVMGTEWSDPPILENPSEVRTIGGREYMLFYDGDRLRLVAFKEGGNSYWVSNSLLQTIGEDEMLAIATSMRRAKV